MSNTDPLAAHCKELLSALGAVQARRMFGGQGLYVDGIFIAMISGDVLYLKADETARPAFQGAGCQPFGFTTPAGHRAVLGYWSAPDEAMESPALMLPWARLALASALRAAAAKRPAAARKTKAVKARTGAPTQAKSDPGATAERQSKRKVRPAPKG